MSVKKLYSEYQNIKLHAIEELQLEIDELLSLSDAYYIAQRDTYNLSVKEHWRQKAEHYRNYVEYYQKYYKVGFEKLCFDAYNIFQIKEITGISLLIRDFASMPPDEMNKCLNPANINMPEEPISISDLQPFKDLIRQKIQEKETEIKKLKTELSAFIPPSQEKPIQVDFNDIKWLYKDSVYEVTGNYPSEEASLLVMDFAEKERRKIERLKHKFSGGKSSDEVRYERIRISEEVRIEVWRRDQGRCVRCGSRENLEYDHIVPVSKGGGNTARNIELLCQDCNRAKGNRIE